MGGWYKEPDGSAEVEAWENFKEKMTGVDTLTVVRESILQKDTAAMYGKVYRDRCSLYSGSKLITQFDCTVVVNDRNWYSGKPRYPVGR